jgi:hypothetical protein
LHFATKISPWIIKVIYWLAPALIMVITNTLILIKLRLIAKRSSQQAAERITNNSVIIVVATTTFIVTTTPLALFFILNPGWNIQAAEVKIKYELRYALLQSLAYMNHAVNFLLYVASAPKFRRELIVVVTGTCRNVRRVTPLHSLSPPTATWSHRPPSAISSIENRVQDVQIRDNHTQAQTGARLINVAPIQVWHSPPSLPKVDI